jgi:hypothetical protein
MDFNEEDAEVLMAWTGILGERRAHPAILVAVIYQDGRETPVMLGRRGWSNAKCLALMNYITNEAALENEEYLDVHP